MANFGEVMKYIDVPENIHTCGHDKHVSCGC